MSLFGNFVNFFEKRDVNSAQKRNNNYNPFVGGGLFFGKYDITMNPWALSAVFAAVELISNSVAELPIFIVKNKNRKDNHRLLDLFKYNPISKFIFIKQLISDLLLYGNSYAYIRKDETGNPVELVYLPKGSVTIVYPQINEKVYYQVTNVKNVPSKLYYENILHLIKNSKDGVQGIGILTYGNQTLKLSEYQNKAASEYFGSGCSISGILKFNEQVFDVDKEEIRRNWQQVHSADGSGLAIIDYNTEYQPVSQNPQQSQMIESRIFQIQEIARYFGINPVLLQDLSHASYSTLEAAQLEFLKHTLQTYIAICECEFTRKLCSGTESFDFDENYLLAPDKTAQANYLQTLVSNGIITINESREVLGLKPVDGGDKLLIAYTDINQNQVNGSSNEKDEEKVDDEDK